MPAEVFQKYGQAIKVYLDWLTEARSRLQEADKQGKEVVKAVRDQNEFQSMLALLKKLTPPQTPSSLELKELLIQTISAYRDWDTAKISLENDSASSEQVEKLFYWKALAEKLEEITHQKYKDFCA